MECSLGIYLWSNEVAHCQRQSQHEKSDPITSERCSVCFLDVDLQKVCGIFGGNGYSGRVRHHTLNLGLKPVSQALEDPGNCLI